jgi:hypothetical protein
MAINSSELIEISRRPKFSRSLKLGCAPTATPRSFAASSVARIVPSSPACRPHAMLADVTSWSSSSS